MGERIAGCDLGKATAKLVIGHREGTGRFVVDDRAMVAHEGRPLEIFSSWYRERGLADLAALGATGLHASDLIDPVVHGLPEEACLEAALDGNDPINLLVIGARGYSVLSRDERGKVRFLESDKCSSGTGENVVRLAARLGLGVEEADRVALAARESIAITARCSVFAKSEMTHFANQGKPADALMRGYFESIARYVLALLSRVQVEAPILVLGGGSRMQTLVAAIRAASDVPVTVPEDASFFEAIGAARLAADQRHLHSLPREPEAIIRTKRARIATLRPASEFEDRVRFLEQPPIAKDAVSKPTLLGLDLGSTGSKAVLASLETGDLVLDVYDRTRGNPVDAAGRLIAAMLARGPIDVRAIGVTGSGREAVAAVLRATFPDAIDRIVVQNEIVAHATAAIRCDEDHGESLSIVEIGGQDAKFVQIVGGQIVESDLNKACSAGTGSFLEEQAVFHGVHDIEEFTALARRATRPPELGQMCTVFVAEAAAEAHLQGFSVEDLFGGFQYSVIHNYIHRVMGQRRFGRRIFFQGKPASGASLAWTLAAVTDREVVVPPNPGAMGAWGIALCASRAVGEASLRSASAFDLSGYARASIVGRSEIQCKDKRCATLCRIDRTTVEVSGRTQVIFSGGACPKFEIATAGKEKLPIEAPSAFDERDALLAPYLDQDSSNGSRVVGVPWVGALAGILPFVVSFLRGIGLSPKVMRSDARSLGRGEERCLSYDACAPVKIAHGVADDPALDLLFLPRVIDLPDREGEGGVTCPMEQGTPEVVERALRARGRTVRIVRPLLRLRDGATSFAVLPHLFEAAKDLGGDPARVLEATTRAWEEQRAYEASLAEIGRRTIAFGRARGIPVVVVCGMNHVVHEASVNAGIPSLLRQNGVLALPMDAFPIPEDTHVLPRVPWVDTARALRVAIAAREQGDIYPLLLSAFGCGPASFAERVFGALSEGHPHTALESDGHGGSAGYVTRIQAFLHTVRRHDGRPSSPTESRLRLLEPLADPPLPDEIDSKLVLFPLGDRLSPTIAAVYRSFGFDAVAASPASAETLAIGRRDCSGKECVPYQLLWGAFRKEVEREPARERTVLLQVQGDGACRNCMFSVNDQLSLERMGASSRVSLRHLRPEHEVHPTLFPRVWIATVAWGILHQLATYHRAFEETEGTIDRMHHDHCDALERIVGTSAGSRTGAFASALRLYRATSDLLDRASNEFAAIARSAPSRDDLRTVLLAGDVYVRLDEFASDGLARRLSARGLRVIAEPPGSAIEYFASESSSDLVGLPTGTIASALHHVGMSKLRRRLYRRVRTAHPWLPSGDAVEAIRAGRELIDRYPRGEAPLTVGSVLHAFDEGYCDGVVVSAPWGCGPSLLSESLLRHRHDIPTMFVYHDGTPIDDRRLDGFAFRLKRLARSSRDPSTRPRADARRSVANP